MTANGTTKDALYEGQSKTSDLPTSGNPVTYYNGRDYHFDWSKGRQLTEAVVGGQTVKYAYDMAGVRSSKQVGDTTYSYTTLSGKVMRQAWGDNNALEFVYDDSSQPFAVIYKHGSAAELYYYLVNAQGDVAAILDSSGTMVAFYDYDAWGNCTVYNSSAKVLTDPTSIANINPLRYRGYYYDAETGFYYLQSRYYDPAICRFINADTFATTDANGFLSANMFAYCENNPIMRVDVDGGVWETVFDIVSLGTSIVEVSLNPTDPWAWAGLVGDVIDLIPFVTGVGEATRAVKTVVKAVDKADDVVGTAKSLYKASDATSAIRKATGSYEVLYESGKNYVGKGGFRRAITSAEQHAKPNALNKYAGDRVVSIRWKSAPNRRAAFIDEYLMQRKRGVRNKRTYNKIWSPGKRYLWK